MLMPIGTLEGVVAFEVAKVSALGLLRHFVVCPSKKQIERDINLQKYTTISSLPETVAGTNVKPRFRLEHCSPETLSSCLKTLMMLSFRENDSSRPLTEWSWTFSSPGDFTAHSRSVQFQKGSQQKEVEGELKKPPIEFEEAFAFHAVERQEGDIHPNNFLYFRLQQHFALDGQNEFSKTLSHFTCEEIAKEIPSFPVSRGFPLLPQSEFQNDAMMAAQKENLDNGSDVAYFWPHRMRREVAVAHRFRHFMVLVNLKPIVRGHLMVVPLRVMPTIHSLTAEEIDEWGVAVKQCCEVLAHYVGGCSAHDGFSVAIQQGKHGGQTVPHLHTHVIVAYKDGKFAGEPEENEEEEQKRRKARTPDEMMEEAAKMRELFTLVPSRVVSNL